MNYKDVVRKEIIHATLFPLSDAHAKELASKFREAIADEINADSMLEEFPKSGMFSNFEQLIYKKAITDVINFIRQSV